VFNGLSTGQPPLPLLLRHLIHRMQLLQQPLLVGVREAAEAGVIAQQPLLILDRKATVLIEPVAEVTRRRGAGVAVARPSGCCIG
jgi:hypothetical protein